MSKLVQIPFFQYKKLLETVEETIDWFCDEYRSRTERNEKLPWAKKLGEAYDGIIHYEDEGLDVIDSDDSSLDTRDDMSWVTQETDLLLASSNTRGDIVDALTAAYCRGRDPWVNLLDEERADYNRLERAKSCLREQLDKAQELAKQIMTIDCEDDTHDIGTTNFEDE